MKVWPSFTIGMVAGVLTGVGALVYAKMRRRKDPAEIERTRRLTLNKTGRITSGEVISLVEPEGDSVAPTLLVYHYEVSGVTYEVAQDVSTLPGIAARAPYLMGQNINVKYEMKHPGNSIIICEEWSGITGVSVHDPQAAQDASIPAATPAKKP